MVSNNEQDEDALHYLRDLHLEDEELRKRDRDYENPQSPNKRGRYESDEEKDDD